MSRGRLRPVNENAVLALLREKQLCGLSEISKVALGYMATDSKSLHIALSNMEREGKIKPHSIKHGTAFRRMYSIGDAS